VNGAGKSSIGGAMFSLAAEGFFNPDIVARQFQLKFPGIRQEEANSLAWQQGRRLLEKAIVERKSFAFETTLGGNTMASLLKKANAAGIEVRVWYVGLESAGLHIARVRSRVALGGHDIPEAKVRERYARSRLNLIDLLPELTELRLFDNTKEGDPQKGKTPAPKLLLHVVRGKILSSYDLSLVPEWAKPILQAAFQGCASPKRRAPAK
jgi:predicted ABC-type ATPase